MPMRGQAGVTSGFVEAEDVQTTSATFVDITDLSLTLTLYSPGRIAAVMAVECSASAVATGEWAIELDDGAGSTVDEGAKARYLSGSNDTGVIAVVARSPKLGPGTYTVKGRHRRVSGGGTISSDDCSLLAFQTTQE